jgi:hypothetical protein
MTPIILRLNFSLMGQPVPSFRNLRPVLAADAQTYFTASVSWVHVVLGSPREGCTGWALDLQNTLHCFSLSFPLRRTVELTTSARMTLASLLAYQGELPPL